MRITNNTLDKVFKSQVKDQATVELQGYKHITSLFCDSSGFGTDNEPALTPEQLKKKLKGLLKKYTTLYTFIGGVGQFQVYIDVYIKENKPNIEKIGNNVFKRVEGGKTIYRLYDTDIVTVEGNKYTLDTGGFNTNLTSKWMNNFIPDNWLVFRKNWKMQLQTDEGIKPFIDDKLIINY